SGDLKRRQWNVDEDIRNEETEQVNLEEDNDSPKVLRQLFPREDACTLQEVDLVANCPLLRVTPSRTPSPAPSYLSSSYKSMGQRPSTLLRPKISLTWVLRGQQHQHNDVNNTASIQESQIIRKSKDRSSRRSVKSIKSIKTKESTEIIDRDKHERCNVLQEIDKIVRHEKVLNQPETPVSSKADQKQDSKDPPETDKVKRAVSEPFLALKESATREKHHRHRRTKRNHNPRPPTRFGYEIADLDSFLTKASIERPANIPVVLSFPTTLYQTQSGGQDEIALPLGTVVNAVFKNQAWLYVQTPHGQEGYVGYAACLPLGILPQPTCGPCWEDSTDVFPRPIGNMTDTEKLRDTRSECGVRERSSRVRRGHRDAVSACGERSVDRLYLRAAANARTKGSRQTLLVIRSDYEGRGSNSISVSKGDVVALLSDHVQGWFWVRSRDSREGFIPAVIAGHGFL
ncbi:GSCOCG00008276001-RA-CDS, partial [Cotesia congregata]